MGKPAVTRLVSMCRIFLVKSREDVTNQVVVFITIADARKIDNDRDTSALQNLGITESRAFQQ